MRAEVTKKLKLARKALQSLGVERETTEQERRLLLDVVATFQEITQQALTTNYGVRDIFDFDEGLRLATLVANRNATFSDDVAYLGHEYAFNMQPGEEAGEKDPVMLGSSTISSRKIPQCDDVEEFLHDGASIPRPLQFGISTWIETLYRDARGFEIGTFNHVLLATLMKKQSSKWSTIVHGYISDIVTVVHRFIQKALLVSCGDIKISTNVLALLMEDLLDRYHRAFSAAEFLLKIEREGTPMTMNHYLNDNLEKW